MPRLDSLPDPDTIKRWKGRLDYYVYRGQPIVRTWPRSPSGPRSPAVKATLTLFNDYMKRVKRTAPQIVAQASADTKGSAWWWRDPVLRATYGLLNETP